MISRALAVTLLGMLAVPPTDTPVYFAQETQGVGDPNPFYENGLYSVFYLKNEGRHPFWLTQTSDLSAWSTPVEAVSVGKRGSPDYWTGSGSVLADPAGGYRLYYTGHDPDGRPKEVVMEARASSLAGPWRKIADTTFAGLPNYDANDFRDPFVFWNAEVKAYWMLLATRHRGRAAIGLYTSPDLARWTPAPPIYTETSPLNLEVPDLFTEGGAWYLLYSDQRDQSRQVRYLTSAHSPGPYAYPRHDALDGRAFYAGKSAGTGQDRLLFGWLAHKRLHEDANSFDWGGDLVVHALKRMENGQLAVHLPNGIARQFDTVRAGLSAASLNIGAADGPLLVRTTLTVRAGDVFGVDFKATRSGHSATLRMDTSRGEASFTYAGDTVNAPRVSFPASPDGRYRLDLVVDPRLGLAIAYINDFRALSFRYYGIDRTTLSFKSQNGFVDLHGTVRTRTGQIAKLIRQSGGRV